MDTTRRTIELVHASNPPESGLPDEVRSRLFKRLDLTEEIPMPRDAEGQIDVDAATQAMNSVIEGWVREYPGQWLWMHRRWR